jgi:predicted SAM-dependent methyltransferase/DNA-directed RNA polymerase subunit RPC12/RpoP
MDIKKLIKSKLSTDFLDRLRYTRSYFYSLRYMGSKYKCPICGGRFRALLGNGRNNAVCPRCESKERHRLIWLYLVERTNLFTDNLKFLHFAPEFCFQRIFRDMDNLRYISVDLNSPSAKLKMDITNMQFDNNSFDCILCIHVLEHIVDDEKAMNELHRVLKPGGWGILHVPIIGWKTLEDPKIVTADEKMRHYGDPDHVRLYGNDFKDKLESAGFSVKVETYLSELDENIIDYYRLMPEGHPTESI